MDPLLIRGGTVVDGTGGPARRADVRLAGGRVTEIGPDLRPDGERPLDASGALVTPGFIETHTHFDPTVFWDPLLDPMPQHGVTTALMGNCSLSLAPVHPEQRQQVRTVFCYVEDVPTATFDVSVPWTWETWDEYTAVVGRQQLGLNVGGLVGHTPLRLWVMGEEAWDRSATPEERAAIVALLETCLDGGAFGLSGSFFDQDPDGRPVPSAIADDAELLALLEVLERRQRVLEFVPRSSYDTLVEDVDRMTGLVRQHPATTSFIGLFVSESNQGRIMAVLDRMGELQAEGVPVIPQVSPRGLDIRANFFGGMSFFRLPKGWHRAVQEMDPEAKRRMLADPAWRDVAREEWDAVPRTMFPHSRPHLARLMEVTDPALEPWVGRTLADLAEARGGHPSDVLADWVLENDLRPGVVGKDVVNGEPELVARTLVHPAALISNSDAGAHLQMFCAAGDSTLLLARHVRDRGDLSVEEAVHQLTGRQADVFGFEGRGRLEPGAVADVAVFALDELRWDDDVFVADLPGGGSRLRRPQGGYRSTIVNGVPTQSNGELTGEGPGRMLLR